MTSFPSGAAVPRVTRIDVLAYQFPLAFAETRAGPVETASAIPVKALRR